MVLSARSAVVIAVTVMAIISRKPRLESGTGVVVLVCGGDEGSATLRDENRTAAAAGMAVVVVFSQVLASMTGVVQEDRPLPQCRDGASL